MREEQRYWPRSSSFVGGVVPIIGLMASIADGVARRLARWPADWEAMSSEELLKMLALDRWLTDEIADNDEVFRHAYLTVREDSPIAEKERYLAALTRRKDLLEAGAMLRDWRHTSGQSVEAPKAHRKRRRKLSKLLRGIEQIGDPTSSGWRRNRWARYAQWCAAHGALPPPKPARRTVYVPWRDSELWFPVTARVASDRTAVLPATGWKADRWSFPPGTRVQCEWRDRKGRPALHAVTPTD
jgi:hypothetical protein